MSYAGVSSMRVKLKRTAKSAYPGAVKRPKSTPVENVFRVRVPRDSLSPNMPPSAAFIRAVSWSLRWIYFKYESSKLCKERQERARERGRSLQAMQTATETPGASRCHFQPVRNREKHKVQMIVWIAKGTSDGCLRSLLIIRNIISRLLIRPLILAGLIFAYDSDGTSLCGFHYLSLMLFERQLSKEIFCNYNELLRIVCYIQIYDW